LTAKVKSEIASPKLTGWLKSSLKSHPQNLLAGSTLLKAVVTPLIIAMLNKNGKRWTFSNVVREDFISHEKSEYVGYFKKRAYGSHT